jgi:DNA-binding GntR family transcriptional regulator
VNASSTSRNLIYREVRRSIILGRRQPGERLDLDALAQQYGTSVTPIRDALQMLGQDGLITIRPRHGYFVTRITLKQLHDMFELREILELASVERAALRITKDQLEELKEVHAGYSGEDDESCERYASENRHFHFLIAQASGNQELADMIGHLHDRLVRFMVLGRSHETTESRHMRLLEALRTGDPTLARQAMLNELNETRQITLERVIREQGAQWRLGIHSA